MEGAAGSSAFMRHLRCRMRMRGCGENEGSTTLWMGKALIVTVNTDIVAKLTTTRFQPWGLN